MRNSRKKRSSYNRIEVTLLEGKFIAMKEISICKGVFFSVPERAGWLNHYRDSYQLTRVQTNLHNKSYHASHLTSFPQKASLTSLFLCFAWRWNLSLKFKIPLWDLLIFFWVSLMYTWDTLINKLLFIFLLLIYLSFFFFLIYLSLKGDPSRN